MISIWLTFVTNLHECGLPLIDFVDDCNYESQPKSTMVSPTKAASLLTQLALNLAEQLHELCIFVAGLHLLFCGFFRTFMITIFSQATKRFFVSESTR